MKNVEFISYLSWAVIGVIICVGSARLGLGLWRHPEPGLFPFLIGCAITLSALSQVILQLLKILKNSQYVETWRPNPTGLKRIIAVFVLLVFYALTLKSLGFIPCTFLFFMVIVKSLGQKSWRYAVLTGFIVAISAHVVFQIWLQTNLPRGPLGV